MRLRWRWAIAVVGVIVSLWLFRRITAAPTPKDLAAADKVDEDQARAVQAWTAACDQGAARSCVLLAKFYGQESNEPNAVGRDDALAARYFRKACDAKAGDGCYGLSRLYEEGRGVPKDRAMAKKFLALAVDLSPRFNFQGEPAAAHAP
jgi:TPR repeat protein